MTAASSPLHGRQILVVEDDYMIAQDIAEVLLGAGAQVLGPVPNLGKALHLVAAGNRIDCAVVDVNLGSKSSWLLVDVLLERSVPIVLATGYSVDALPRAYAHLHRCEKPVGSEDLTRTIVGLVSGTRTPQEVIFWYSPPK